MGSPLQQASWFVLHTRSRHEAVVHNGLQKKGIPSFLPKARVPSTRKDRKLMIDVPLFPGYLFVKTDLEPYQHVEILKTIGAVRLIGTKDTPIAVPETAVNSLEIMAAARLAIETGSRLVKGDPVIVVAGPFTGIRGFFDHRKGQGRVVVNVDVLGQFAAVEVDADQVEPAESDLIITA